VVGTVALCALIGVGWGLLAAGLHGVIYVFFLSSSINGLCHARGYRTFDNTATNIPWLALLTGGEGFHNNHHGFPRSPKFSARSSEIDPSWPIIRLLTPLKLARVYHTIEETSRGGWRNKGHGRREETDGGSVRSYATFKTTAGWEARSIVAFSCAPSRIASPEK